MLRRDEVTGQIILSGMGELHLEVAVERMAREHGARPKVGRPSVELREGIRRAAEAEAAVRLNRPDGTVSGRIRLRVEPEEGLKDWTLSGNENTPPGWTEAIRSGIGEALEHRVLGVRVAVLDLEGSPNGEAALKMAAAEAARKALLAAETVVLQPVVDLEIAAPEAVLGEVLADLKARNARVVGLDERSGIRVVKATAPLAGLFGYAGELRSKTRGRASFSMQFRGYEPMTGRT
jgi:elongation factor G